MKKWEKALVVSPFLAMVFGGTGLWFYYGLYGARKKYVVTDIKKERIVYRPLNDTSDLHVMPLAHDFQPGMEADSATYSRIRHDIYDHIQPGDTITGYSRSMDNPVSESFIYRGTMAWSVEPVITQINGKDVETFREIARHDSLLRNNHSRGR